MCINKYPYCILCLLTIIIIILLPLSFHLNLEDAEASTSDARSASLHSRSRKTATPSILKRDKRRRRVSVSTVPDADDTRGSQKLAKKAITTLSKCCNSTWLPLWLHPELLLDQTCHSGSLSLL